jgi:hypothetical protein
MKEPAHEIRYGLIAAEIWRRDTKAGERHVVTLFRLFKNGDTWQRSAQLGRDDLLTAAKLLNECHSWIFQETQGQRAEERSSP